MVPILPPTCAGTHPAPEASCLLTSIALHRAGHLDPVLEHFPHAGTHQMNGLVTPAEAAALPPEYQQASGVPFAPGEGMPPLPLEPAQLPELGNIITSGFEAQQGVQRRSGSGSHSQVCPYPPGHSHVGRTMLHGLCAPPSTLARLAAGKQQPPRAVISANRQKAATRAPLFH